MAEYFFNFNKIAYVQGIRATTGCILCGVAQRDPAITSLLVAESRHWFICGNLYPYNPGHCMIFPRKHVEDIREIDAEQWSEFARGQRLILDVLDSLYKPQGYNIGFNQGKPAGASIAHIHCHIIPRYFGEVGIGDLLGGKRVLVEDPRDSCSRMQKELTAMESDHGFSPIQG